MSRTVSADMSTPNIIVDPEFHAYIPALTPEEMAQLEANILADGCRDPLVLWGEVLIDGHNRYDICTRHGLPFATVQREFADREAALDWMDAHQLGRRNLTPDARKLLLGRRYNRLKKGDGERGPKKLDQNEPASTAGVLAREHGVSEATVKRAGKFAEEVEADEELKAAVEAGRPVAAIKREREATQAPPEPPPAPAPVDPERRRIGRLTTEAMIDEIIGLTAALNDEKGKNARLTRERDELAAQLAEALAGDQGKVIGSLQGQLRAAKFARDEAKAAAKRMEFKLKKAEARVKELENMEVSFG